MRLARRPSSTRRSSDARSPQPGSPRPGSPRRRTFFYDDVPQQSFQDVTIQANSNLDSRDIASTYVAGCPGCDSGTSQSPLADSDRCKTPAAPASADAVSQWGHSAGGCSDPPASSHRHAAGSHISGVRDHFEHPCNGSGNNGSAGTSPSRGFFFDSSSDSVPSHNGNGTCASASSGFFESAPPTSSSISPSTGAGAVSHDPQSTAPHMSSHGDSTYASSTRHLVRQPTVQQADKPSVFDLQGSSPPNSPSRGFFDIHPTHPATAAAAKQLEPHCPQAEYEVNGLSQSPKQGFFNAPEPPLAPCQDQLHTSASIPTSVSFASQITPAQHVDDAASVSGALLMSPGERLSAHRIQTSSNGSDESEDAESNTSTLDSDDAEVALAGSAEDELLSEHGHVGTWADARGAASGGERGSVHTADEHAERSFHRAVSLSSMSRRKSHGVPLSCSHSKFCSSHWEFRSSVFASLSFMEDQYPCVCTRMSWIVLGVPWSAVQSLLTAAAIIVESVAQANSQFQCLGRVRWSCFGLPQLQVVS
jgi:hypothetical protein